jgi:hypothetical protein
MRLNFISRLTLLIVAGYLVVATQVWPEHLEWMFIVGGIVLIALAAIDASNPDPNQRSITALVVGLGIWSIVEAIVFDGSALKWVSFWTALATAVVAASGLVIHELTAEQELGQAPGASGRGHMPQAASS